MTERSLTLMAVHAHPDDEATSTGGVLARYAAEGITTVLVTCTDGRCGDGPGGVKPGDPGHDPQAVVAMRQAELTASCAALKVTHLETLDYADSGMMGWAANDAPGAFWNTPVAEAADRLAELIRRYRPDVVVTYDENGFYGHPDHIQAHRITMAAVERTDIPAKVYWTTVPRSAFQEFGRVMKEIGVEFPEPDESSEMPELGLPDDEITTWVDIGAYGGQKFESLAAHASQAENIFFLQLGQERFTELMGVETFVRVRDTTGAATPEDDLFAGLR
ncbi:MULTISPECIES: PIG-L family deacetylase [Micromonospora]|uniref:GlcNAc-PI de-N-acetylase n=1 Tax=Micromonospora solifontis TaxID=2487138 RepID=A0ABX9WEI3_9ACTN|nr:MULTISPECIES: PIG-L family deacetylase [Micromonospora]NES16281.1 GlcNAc-PI de-N-acetylase [Micromonospora sp. PPF5-17B]NES38341.1 GlcNAc-PI de-N-acetylase [Micromonospora solifontis]NES58093.1 GlcNAc-PI de-N-acetylase [Micromonospora sp. PPF5-6]RNL95874.1 GlcNAc-PI de-N-acetylase [Micromonospora solifontis]